MIRPLPRSTIPIGGLLLLALIPRVYMLFKFRTALVDWDEAVVGLMARHILQGELPIFYYGQYYMGTLEAFLAALLFAVFGAEPVILKIAPLIPFCGFLIVHFFLAQRIAGRRVAFLATLLLAVSPPFLTIWSLKARGGYTILLLLGTSALLIASRMLEQGYRRRDAALLGMVLGLAWWTHFLSVVYLFPVALLLLLHDERRWFGTAGLCFAGAFLAGSLPFWIFNVQHPAASLGIGGARQTSYLADLANIFSIGLPIILSARPNWGRPGTDFLPWASVITTGVFFVSLTAIFVRVLRGGPQPGHGDRLQLLAVFVGLFPLLLSSTGFASFMLEPRYLIPLYSAIYILILTAVAARSAQMVLCGLLLVLNCVGTARIAHADFSPPGESTRPLIEALQRHGVRAAFADYDLAYRLTFESKETILCTPPPGPKMRYQPYLDFVKSVRSPAYITPGRDIDPPEDSLVFTVGNYTIHLPRSSE